jgi:hypothetical protein
VSRDQWRNTNRAARSACGEKELIAYAFTYKYGSENKNASARMRFSFQRHDANLSPFVTIALEDELWTDGRSAKRLQVSPRNNSWCTTADLFEKPAQA